MFSIMDFFLRTVGVFASIFFIHTYRSSSSTRTCLLHPHVHHGFHFTCLLHPHVHHGFHFTCLIHQHVHHGFLSANCGSVRWCLLHPHVDTEGDFFIGLSLCATLANSFGGRSETSVPNTTTFCRRRFLQNPCHLYAPHPQFEDSQAS